MKTKRWMFASSILVAFLLGTSCSSDWGKVDPPAGVQTFPKLENVATYEFEEEHLDPLLFKAYAGESGQIPQIVEDEKKGNVLEFNNGWVEINNPMPLVTCQEAASLTFWFKQIPATIVDEEGNESLEPQDLKSPIISFTNANRSASLAFSANGGIEYDAADGQWSENNPDEYATGYMPQNQWNYVALTVRNDGYDLYVNGERKVKRDVDNFDCSKLVAFMNKVETVSLGSSENTGHWMIDDLKLYRNALTAKEITRPRLPGEGGQTGFDFATFDYVQDSPKLNIGSPDCSTGWWSEFSNYFRLPAATNLKLSFINHTSGGGNWNNWNLCLATDADRGADGYEEYFVIRSDLYGWGAAYNGDNWTNEGYGNWDQFRLDMEGADVVLDIRREGAEILVKATATALNGTVYVENFHATCGEGDQIVRAFLIVDGSYLELDGDMCRAYWDAPVENAIVGALDNSTAWWSVFSDYFTIQPNLALHLGFNNFTSGGGNWNNWNLCVATDADRGEAGYEEYFVVRSDLYGWGASYNGDNWTSTGYGDWDQFRIDMDNAYVDLDVVRANDVITATAVAVSGNGNGNIYKESIWGNCGDGSQIVRAFLICDGSHFEFNTTDCYTYKCVFK